MALLSERDAGSWHALAGRIAAVLEPRLSHGVQADRANVRGSSWAPAPFRPALLRARRRAAALERRAPLALQTDVADFYPSVAPPVLARALRRAGVVAEDARQAADMLESWGSDGYPGLPIGPPGSAVLANAVLHELDLALSGRLFLRWVDDYLVGLPSDRSVAPVLEHIDTVLGDMDLWRSAVKTQVVDDLDGFRWLGRSPVAPALAAPGGQA